MENEELTPSSGIIGAISEQAGTLVGGAVVGAKRAAIAVRQMMTGESGPVIELIAEEPGQSGVEEEEADSEDRHCR